MKWVWWGYSQPYAAIRQRQIECRQELIEGRREEFLAFLEHSPVVTIGRRAAQAEINRAAIEREGIPICSTERGGLATYHGPGQLMVYVFVNVQKRSVKIRCLVDALEKASIAFLSERGHDATRREGQPGVWVQERKLLSVGLHFSRGVSMHGLALNVSMDLNRFALLRPCGLDSGVLGSLETMGEEPVELKDLCPRFAFWIGKFIEEASCA